MSDSYSHVIISNDIHRVREEVSIKGKGLVVGVRPFSPLRMLYGSMV